MITPGVISNLKKILVCTVASSILDIPFQKKANAKTIPSSRYIKTTINREEINRSILTA